MKRLETIFVALTLLAFAMSINGIVGGNILSLLLSTALIFVCIGLGVKAISNTAEGTSNQRALALASYTAGSSLVVLASLFRFMFWPFGHMLLYQGTFICAIVFIVTLVAYSRSKDKYNQKLLLRNGLYLGWAVLLILMPARVLVSYKYGNSPFYPAYVRVSDAIKADPDNKELWEQQRVAFKKLQDTRQYLDSIDMTSERGK